MQLARGAGALSTLQIVLSQRIGILLHAGEFAGAASLVKETEAVDEATGNDPPAYGALALTGWQGREADASRLMETIGDDVMTRSRHHAPEWHRLGTGDRGALAGAVERG